MSFIYVDDLTAEDFSKSGWEEVITSQGDYGCNSYSGAFNQKAIELRDGGDDKTARIFDLLVTVCSMYMRRDNADEPFGPMLQIERSRTASLADFDGKILEYLESIQPLITDSELLARIADVLWLRRRNRILAERAVIAYLDAALQFVTVDRWTLAEDRIGRALDLAYRLNNRLLASQVESHIGKILMHLSNGIRGSFLPARLMTMLLDRDLGDADVCNLLAEDLASLAETENDWNKAREYWKIAARWSQTAKDEEKRRASNLKAAETYISEAESHAARDNATSYMTAAHWLERGIQAFRNIGGMTSRVEELHKQLIHYQERSLPAMSTISHAEDATEMAMESQARVSGKDNLYDALFAFTQLSRSPRKAALMEQAERFNKDFVLSSLFANVILNDKGHVIARGVSGTDEASKQARLLEDMFKNAILSRSVFAQGCIEPARQQINLEHRINLNELIPLVRDNPFVPEGREGFFARGLLAGLQGDFVVASHLLIPQFENSLRVLLTEAGVTTSTVDAVGVQKQLDLNVMLGHAKFLEPLERILGEDIVFDLRGLLVEPFGSNLRNEMAHGLRPYDAFQSFPCCYLWWLTLRLLCIPIIASIRKESEEKNTSLDEVECTT